MTQLTGEETHSTDTTDYTAGQVVIACTMYCIAFVLLAPVLWPAALSPPSAEGRGSGVNQPKPQVMCVHTKKSFSSSSLLMACRVPLVSFSDRMVVCSSLLLRSRLGEGKLGMN